jgi:hypothetical protein
MSFKFKGILTKLFSREVVIDINSSHAADPAETSMPPDLANAPNVEAVCITCNDANNLLRSLEQELANLVEDKALLVEQYAAAKQEGNQLKTEIVARSYMGAEQTIVLKKNLYGELAAVEQMLSWDENRSAFDYISQSFSIDPDRSQKEFSARIAQHTVRRSKQFDLAQTVKEGEAALGKMRDVALDDAMTELDQLVAKQAGPAAAAVPIEPIPPVAGSADAPAAGMVSKTEAHFPELIDPAELATGRGGIAYARERIYCATGLFGFAPVR